MTDTSAAEEHADRRSRSDRLAAIVFGIYVAVAYPLILFKLGTYHWFLRDDWLFITSRGITWDSLFSDHDSHWSTLPVLVFRLLYEVFGLNSYRPYQAVVLLAHVAVVVQVRLVLRRARVNAWLATALAGALVLFAPGREDIVWAFQIGFTGSIALGLAQLLLADHPGGFGRRDVVGLGCGLLALMCSGTAVTMVIAVGLALLIGRGWRRAALHTIPLAAVYAIWWLAERPPTVTAFYGRPGVSVVLRWVRTGTEGVFSALGHFQVVSVLYAGVLVVGLGLLVLRLGPGRSADGDTDVLRAAVAPAVGLLLAAVPFMVLTAQLRWGAGPQGARAGRYLYLLAVLVLPALGLATQEISRRVPRLTPLLVVLLLVPLIPNATGFDDEPFGKVYFEGRRTLYETAVTVPFARTVPKDVTPLIDPYQGPVTIGFLLAAHDRGDFPTAQGSLSPGLRNELRVRLGIASRKAPGTSEGCTVHTQPMVVRPSVGTTFWLATPVGIRTVNRGRPSSDVVVFNPGDGRKLVVVMQDLRLRLSGPDGRGAFTLCRR